MKIEKQIPNILTLANLSMGLLAISFAFFYSFENATYCIIAAAFFDFFDGTLARILKAESYFGKELDSLADIVSFGVAPGMLLFNIIYDKAYLFSLWNNLEEELWVAMGITFLIPIFSAIRLAKFNISETQKNIFLGLPTPANALLIASFPFILDTYVYNIPTETYLLNIYTVILFCLCSSSLLVAPVPLMSFKFKNFNFNKYLYHVLFISISLPILIIFGLITVPLIFILYLVLSLLDYISKLNSRNK